MSVFSDLYRGKTKFDFVGISKTTLKVSLALVVLSVLMVLVRPFNLSVDFTGGVIVAVPNNSGATVEEYRADLRSVGFGDARVQVSSEGFVTVQTESLDPEEQIELVSVVASTAEADVHQVNVDAVGPTFGAEMTKSAIKALAVFLVVVSLFMTWRFEWKMAIAALAALVFDLTVTAGLYALIGFVVTPATVIAVLTILGYSLYDTVVVYEKVKENEHDLRTKTTISNIVNLSVNQVLMRSINTSLTSLLPVGSLLLVGVLAIGGETLKEFALALFIGITIGTYSSIFVSAPILAMWKETEPEWERQRRRVERASAGVVVADDAIAEVARPSGVPSQVARPPKQRRKRR